jgi:glycosyltransferase involved in cell wall biosynthesis
MNIIVVGPSYPFRGGISHYTTFLYRHLVAQHTVRLLTFSRQYPAWLYPGQSDRDESSALRIPAAEPMLDGANPLTWIRTGWDIRRAAPDVLILQWTVPYWIPLIGLLLLFAPRRTKKVIIVHNATPHEKENALFALLRRLFQKMVMGWSSLLICHAGSDEQVLRQQLPHHPIKRVMLPGYAAIADNTSLTTSKKPGDPHFLFFGFVRPYKGIEVLLAAMPKVVEALPYAHLTIAGEWWANAGDPAALIPSALQPYITLLNRYVSNEETAALFHTADAAVLPYRSATQSAVVQVAFGFGVPVITTNVGGLPEAVTHEVSGMVVPPDDPDALAEALIRYHQEGWRPRLAPGVAAARERFSWAALEAAIVED